MDLQTFALMIGGAVVFCLVFIDWEWKYRLRDHPWFAKPNPHRRRK